MNFLFVCSKNKWRSRTAETIFKMDSENKVRSAGTSEESVIKLTEKLLYWADLVFVMEDKHRNIIKQKFLVDSYQDKLIVLDIPDEYQYMDEELILSLRIATEPYFNNVFKK